MTKVLKKEKINYLKGSKPYLDNTISYDNISNNNISNNNINNNNINITLTNISNQLKNIAIIDKNKEFKLNSSFHIKNKNKRNNNFNSNIKSNNNNNSNNSNYYINTSMNIENNQNKSNFFDITTNLEINQKFQNLREMRVFNFYILKTINYESYNINYEDIKKENVDLKENIKFLLKQIKKYQKSGLTIDDMDINRQKELENYEKKINELKMEINTYKNKIISLNKNNKELIRRNEELNDFINSNLNLKESRNKYNGSINNQEKEIEQFYDIDAFNEKSYEYNNLNMVYNSKKNLIESDNNSKLSEELLADINYEIPTGRNKSNFLYIKDFSINNIKKPRTNYSEGKLYCRKNVGKKYLNFNDDPYSSNNIRINGNKNFTYSRSHLKNNISFKKQ